MIKTQGKTVEINLNMSVKITYKWTKCHQLKGRDRLDRKSFFFKLQVYENYI